MAELSIRHSFNFLLLHQDICEENGIANANLRFNSCKYLEWLPSCFLMASPSGVYVNVCQCMMIDKDDTEQPPPFCQSNIQNMADSLPFILGICWTQNRQVSVIIMLKPNIPSYIFY